MRRHLAALEICAVLGDAIIEGFEVAVGEDEALAFAFIEFCIGTTRGSRLRQHGFGAGEYAVAAALESVQKIVRGISSHEGTSVHEGMAARRRLTVTGWL